jgi:hypothetical protein
MLCMELIDLFFFREPYATQSTACAKNANLPNLRLCGTCDFRWALSGSYHNTGDKKTAQLENNTIELRDTFIFRK